MRASAVQAAARREREGDFVMDMAGGDDAPDQIRAQWFGESEASLQATRDLMGTQDLGMAL